jgi:hypothetical protein
MRWFCLFVLILLVLPVPVQAQSEMPPPRLLVAVDGAKEQSLGLIRADVLVQIAGPLAQTTMTLTFKNDTARVLQGDLDFPLPEGATISGYGLDVNGKMVDGVPVEKQEARVAFEQEVQKGADPGLVEHTVGNSFRTRVYPIPARGTRTIKVQYVSGLLTSGSDLVYRVPLNWNQTLPEAHITVDTDQVGTFPKLRFGERTQLLNFQHEAAHFTATKTFENIAFDTDMEVRLPDAAVRSLTVTEPFTRTTLGEPETYFVASTVPPYPAQVDAPRPVVHRIGLVWDASLSRQASNGDRERQILRDLFRRLGSVTVDVTILRNIAEPRQTFSIVNGDDSALEKYLKDTVYDGGTQLGVAPFPTNAPDGTRYDFHLFFSDGLGTLGKDLPFPSVVPVYTLNSNPTANHELLRHIAERSGGIYLNLTSISDTQAVQRIGKPAFSLLSVTVEQGRVADIFPNGQEPVQGRVFVTGRLLTNAARLRLSYGSGGRVTYTETVDLRRAGDDTSNMVGRFWAQRKVEDLMLLPEQNQEWLLSLGKDFNIVTPNTSLIVLERLDQYIEHGITPPRSSPELYFAYKAQMHDQNLAHRRFETDKITRMVEMWNEKVDWWHQKFPAAMPKPTQLNGGTRQLQSVSGVAAHMAGRVAVVPLEARASSVTGYAVAAPVAMRGRGGFGGGRFGGGGSPPPMHATVAAVGQRGTLSVVAGGSSSDSNGDASSVSNGVSGGTIQANVTLNTTSASDVHVRPAGNLEAVIAAPAARTVDFDEVDEVSAAPRQFGFGRKAKAGEAVEDSTTATVAIKPWSPNTPYLKAMKADPTHAYNVFLAQRSRYATAPAFYLDCAEFLLQRGQTKLGIRVLTDILELRLDDAQLTRIVAHRLAQLAYRDLAIGLFERVTRMRPDEPQSWRDLALILADRADALAATNPARAIADYNRSLKLLNKVVLGRWADRFEEIESVVLMEANRIIVHARHLPPSVASSLKIPLDKRLIKNLDCDVRIVMTWDSDFTDMDLWVDEPTGERCMYSNNRTAIGGRLSRDFTEGYGPEEYLLHHAPKGKYLIRTNYFGEHDQRLTGATIVQATVFTNFGRANEKRQTLTLRLTTEKETVNIGSAQIK